MRDASSAGRSLIGLVVMLAGPARAAGIPASAGSLGPGAAGVLTPTQARETEDRLRQVIAGLEQGQPDYDQMEPALRIAVRQQIGATTGMLQVLGPIQSIAYEGKQGSADVFDVRFAAGEGVWLIALSPEGKIATLFVNRPVFAPAATQSRLEQVIRQLQQGEPDYDQMTPTLRAAVERQRSRPPGSACGHSGRFKRSRTRARSRGRTRTTCVLPTAKPSG